MESIIDTQKTVQALAALAQETRLDIFRLLVQAGPTGLAAGEIGAELKLAPATLSFHLKELSRAGLITARQDGRYIYYSANFVQMGALVGFLTENCCARDGLDCAPAACFAPPVTVTKPVKAAKVATKAASKAKSKATTATPRSKSISSAQPKPQSNPQPKRKGVKA